VSLVWLGVALVTGSALAWLLSAVAVSSPPNRLVRANHAGRPVPAVLGLVLVAGVAGGALAPILSPDVAAGSVMWTVLAGVIVVTAAGLLDDLAGGKARGFGGHLGSLARGRPTTGIVKLVVGVGVGAVVAAQIGGGGVRVVAATVLIAGAVNLWNALDVVPGRSLKWGVVVLIGVVVATRAEPLGLVAAAALGAAGGVLPADLTERGMLGDSGSNPLGLVVGAGLAVALSTPWVVVAASVILALQVAAETVTISRLIRAVPPLRWFDALGRRAG
jgi:UDP-GlcNAc:undecaprenyl-phosphate/decaprenyl-phosphate GlcNAc-1-phosphate transferase